MKKLNHNRAIWVGLLCGFGLCGVSLSAKPKIDHYRFILSSGYVGWIQVVFAAPEAPGLPVTEDRRALLIRVGESGVVRTGNLWVHSRLPKDEFFYQVQDSDGREKLVPLPDNYVLDDGYNTHRGFDINGTPDIPPATRSSSSLVLPTFEIAHLSRTSEKKSFSTGRNVHGPTPCQSPAEWQVPT